MNQPAQKNCVVELHFESSKKYSDPYNEIEMEVQWTTPQKGTLTHPAFWAGDQTWKARFAPPEAGEYRYHTICSNPDDKGLHNRTGQVTSKEYDGANTLFRQGRLRISPEKQCFEHRDGTPFFWIGDTWWMGLCGRLDLEGFHTLTDDRVRKGFNVIQIVAGPLPDMDAWDPRGRNEAGFPLTRDFHSINPAFYDLADLKLEHLWKHGLMPCIVGMWGYYLSRIGVEKAKKFWRYLVARYGAYPVVWCIAGEANSGWYLSEPEKKEEESRFQKKGWAQVAVYVHDIDGFGNLVTIHPTMYGRDAVEDDSVLDFEMLQTGHDDLESVPKTAKRVCRATAREPKMPVIVGETNYEGILGRSWQNIQRMCFYKAALNGAVGYTYGANGVWQVNLPGEPYGRSTHGVCWGNTPWREAYQLPGSRQIGIGGEFIRRFPWWEIERHAKYVEPQCDRREAYSCVAAGIDGKLRIIYMPMLWFPPKISDLEPGVRYLAFYFDPISGKEHKIGRVEPDSGRDWVPPVSPPENHDWVIVLEAV